MDEPFKDEVNGVHVWNHLIVKSVEYTDRAFDSLGNFQIIKALSNHIAELSDDSGGDGADWLDGAD